jgi:hypothetical protein
VRLRTATTSKYAVRARQPSERELNARLLLRVRAPALTAARLLFSHLTSLVCSFVLTEKTGAVIDVFSNMWGPCDMIAGHFFNFFYDLGETYGLKFVRATSDKVTCLREYKDSSKPLFLFYLGGQEVEKIEGCNLPAILDTIKGKAPKIAV